MNKPCLFVLASLLLLSGCGGSNNSVAESPKTIESEGADHVDNTLAESASDDTEVDEPTDDTIYEYNQTVYSDEYINIDLISSSAQGITFEIQGNSEQNLTVYCDYMTINGIQYPDEDMSIYSDITATAKQQNIFTYSNAGEEIKGLQGQFYICDFDTCDEMKTLYFEFGESFTTIGNQLGENEFLTVEYVETSDVGIVMRFTNNTSNDIRVYSEDLTIDGNTYNSDEEIAGTYYYSGLSENPRIAPGTSRLSIWYLQDIPESVTDIHGQFLITEYPTGNHMGLLGF